MQIIRRSLWFPFSYSRQNLLSASSKSNADGHLGVGPVYNPHPLVERSHNALHPPSATAAATPPANTPKRNVNHAAPNNEDNRQRRNVTYERSLSFSSAPDVLNVNQTPDDNLRDTRHANDDPRQNVNLNYNELSHRNLNISDVIPEIIQSHSNNINTSPHTKKKSSTKLPAKNSSSRRNYLDYSQTSNINIASSSETVNPNLATTSQDNNNKATKIFDLLRENVYSEVTALIGVNESHPDFLIQLFRDLQQISSEPVRQRVLQSIRSVLTQYPHIIDNHNSVGNSAQGENINDTVSTTTEAYDVNVLGENRSGSGYNFENDWCYFLADNDTVITPVLLNRVVTMVVNSSMENDNRNISKKRLLEALAKYEGFRVSDVSEEIMESINRIKSGNDHEPTPQVNQMSEPLQDVAGSMNLFSSSDSQLREVSPCPFELWSVHSHMHSEAAGSSGGNSREERQVDLINCTEMQNGDLAEADQTHSDVGLAAGSEEVAMNGDGLPDVVDTEETTPTEVRRYGSYCKCLTFISCYL